MDLLPTLRGYRLCTHSRLLPMSTDPNRQEYARRMHRVLAHIDRHLDAPLDVHTLAGVAHFSPFHFHRLFTALMGETVGDYLRRRRLEVAAQRLAVQPSLSVLQAALAVGFGSAEAFARAFKARFGVSPTAWRRSGGHVTNSKTDQMDGKRDQASPAGYPDLERILNQITDAHMIVKLIDRPAAPIAYLRYVGPYGEDVSRFWMETYYPWAVTRKLGGSPRYGISHDDPFVTAPDQCRYDACVEVPEDYTDLGPAFKTTIPAGVYATYRFKGTAADIMEAWTRLLREWLPASGYQLDNRPSFEYYPVDADDDPDTGVFECDICIPVMPL
ncbi:MAG: GyrI-like domain-containing protein [Rhodothermales bacterium]